MLEIAEDDAMLEAPRDPDDEVLRDSAEDVCLSLEVAPPDREDEVLEDDTRALVEAARDVDPYEDD